VVYLVNALDGLRQYVNGAPLNRRSKMPDVFIVFDEAHSLTQEWDPISGFSNYITLRQVLHEFTNAPLFTFFLSTTGKISKFSPPRTRDPSKRIAEGIFLPSRPFVELGFDQLMHDRKVLDKYNTLEDVTSSECISHMGRPL
jgi:hypothetical protein